MNDCIFCKIANGIIPSQKVFEDDVMIVFKDINPQANIHLLAVPKNHFSDVTELAEKSPETLTHIFQVIAEKKDEFGFKNGMRVITNVGDDGCQSVKHVHIHLLGGEKLSERMG